MIFVVRTFDRMVFKEGITEVRKFTFHAIPRTPACMRISMAMHFGCFWFNDASW